ncbi:MAG: hypothetical protein LPJ89_11450 [Hymenobacteraceae bacterium]|nr:hypothetical protein [Hymenobacteraceae bacterium]MDX5394873.1 hypothetical protein [Hymenobacteraceae bacterium]MDX5444381.1 hypothetical protein [Hymenobacteraceae bacterium]MDX5510908.1 hypothetical protein [Hymenobacteraceae bacterium]
MNQFLYIVLSFCVLMQSGSKTLLLLHHQAYKTTITELFCENKAKPELDCQGSCHLKKKLQEAAAAEKQKQPVQEKQAELTLFCQQSLSLSLLLYKHAAAVSKMYYADAVTVPPVFEVFHPPATN